MIGWDNISDYINNLTSRSDAVADNAVQIQVQLNSGTQAERELNNAVTRLNYELNHNMINFTDFNTEIAKITDAIQNLREGMGKIDISVAMDDLDKQLYSTKSALAQQRNNLIRASETQSQYATQINKAKQDAHDKYDDVITAIDKRLSDLADELRNNKITSSEYAAQESVELNNRNNVERLQRESDYSYDRMIALQQRNTDLAESRLIEDLSKHIADTFTNFNQNRESKLESIRSEHGEIVSPQNNINQAKNVADRELLKLQRESEDAINKLNDAYDAGILTQSEYDTAIQAVNDEIAKAVSEHDQYVQALEDEIKLKHELSKVSALTNGASDKYVQMGKKLTGFASAGGFGAGISGKLGNFLQSPGGAKMMGMADMGVRAVGQIAETAVNFVNIGREKDLAVLSADVKTASNELKTASEIASRNIARGGDVVTKSLGALNTSLSSGVIQGAFAAASSEIELSTSSFATTMENYMGELKLSMLKEEIRLEKKRKLDELNLKQAGQVIDGIGGVLNLIPGATGVIGGMVTGIIGSAVKTYASYKNAKNQFELEKTKLENELVAAQEQAFQVFSKAVVDTASKIVQAGQDFYKSVRNAYDKANDETVKTGRFMGFAGDQVDRFITNTLIRQTQMSVVNDKGVVKRIDKSPEDMMRMQSAYAENAGFAIELGGTDYLKTFSLGKLWGDDTAQALVTSMQLFNKSAADSSDLMYEMYDIARRTGISQVKYSKSLVNNLKMAEKFQFKGGTRALMEMAAWAQKTRFNMDSLANMLSDIQDGGLENVITKSASLQVLGGNFAMGADPLAMMFEGFNDPAALADRYNKMISQMGTFNRTTGEVDFSAGQKMTMSQFAKATNQDVGDVMNQQRQRLRSIEIDKSLYRDFTEEQRNLIYSKATFDKDNGIWTVNGKNINEMNATDFDELAPIDERIEKHVANMLSILESDQGITIHGNVKVAYDNESTLKDSAERMQSDQDNFYVNATSQLTGLITEAAKYTEQAQKNAHDRLIQTVDMVHDAYATMNRIASDEVTNLALSAKEASEAMKLFAKNGVEALRTVYNKTYGDKAVSAATEKAHTNATANANARQTVAKGMQNNVATTSNSTQNNATSTTQNNTTNNATASTQNYATARTQNNTTNNATASTQNYATARTQNNTTNNATASTQNYATNIATATTQNYATASTQNYATNNAANRPVLISYPGYNPTQYSFTNILNKTGGDGYSPTGFAMLPNPSNVVPVSDGEVAMSNPSDHALFGKIGGPFDKLFSGILPKVDMVYDAIATPTIEPQSYVAMQTIGTDGHVTFDTIKIEGSLNLTGQNGQSIDIIKELENNPALLREVTRLVSDGISKQLNGGRSQYKGGRMVSFG